MSPAFRAKLLALALLLAGSVFQAPPVQAHTLDQINEIETAYARMHGGRNITDAQLEYYLDRLHEGWTMQRVMDDMDDTGPWRPAPGWTAREVICSSINNQYAECPVPFRGTAMITQQISNSPCIEGRTWGNKPGAVWVRSGCRARFGIVGNSGPLPPERTVTCNSYRGRYRECRTGFRGHVYLRRPAPDSRACIEGRTWGQRPGVVWVRRNCRAQFSSVGRPGPRDDYGQTGGWVRDPNYAVTCASVDGRRTVCTWDNRYGTPYVVEQISSSQCIEGRDWGYDVNGGLWVNSGCRARFGYREGRYDTTTWVRDPNYAVTCSSMDGRRTVCTWDTRYGAPYLIEQISSSACVEGRDWGYDRNGELWVSSGCRARFGYR